MHLAQYVQRHQLPLTPLAHTILYHLHIMQPEIADPQHRISSLRRGSAAWATHT